MLFSMVSKDYVCQCRSRRKAILQVIILPSMVMLMLHDYADADAEIGQCELLDASAQP